MAMGIERTNLDFVVCETVKRSDVNNMKKDSSCQNAMVNLIDKTRQIGMQCTITGDNNNSL